MITSRTPDLDYHRLINASKSLPAISGQPAVRIAILSDAAIQQFVPLLKALFAENGYAAEVFEGAFDAVELEAIDPGSALYRFRPDVVVIAECSQALRSRYYRDGGAGFVEAAERRMVRIWEAVGKNTAARLIQCNFALPYERQFGNYDLLVPDTFYAAAVKLNSRVAECARERNNVLVCDVESLASWAGRRTWYDNRLWNLAKTFCSMELLPVVAQAWVDIVLSTKGRVVKCVVLDLDNTLWGGVVGDDGPLGVAIGAHGDGEPFYHLQQYLLSLKQRGILLAVCSKNDLANALGPFSENPEMILKRDDITVFVANWENKADNIRSIRDTLEIGLDAMVFLDDSPFERNLVRQMLPEVIVPELPEDPSDYVSALSLLNLFEASSFSAEDVRRAALYQQEAQRREVQSSFTNIDDYLKALGMRMELARFTAPRLARISQLIQRSNQFNLTTHRYSAAQCEAMMLDRESWVPLSASLVDRFGDHGLISIVILKIAGQDLVITDWLMSCRVLVRGVEQTLMNEVVALAKERRLHTVRGEYIPTAKNAMVKDFYRLFGFTQDTDENGKTAWSLEVNRYLPAATFIEVEGKPA